MLFTCYYIVSCWFGGLGLGLLVVCVVWVCLVGAVLLCLGLFELVCGLLIYCGCLWVLGWVCFGVSGFTWFVSAVCLLCCLCLLCWCCLGLLDFVCMG